MRHHYYYYYYYYYYYTCNQSGDGGRGGETPFAVKQILERRW